jgi:hypothetical protein
MTDKNPKAQIPDSKTKFIEDAALYAPNAHAAPAMQSSMLTTSDCAKTASWC